MNEQRKPKVSRPWVEIKATIERREKAAAKKAQRREERNLRKGIPQAPKAAKKGPAVTQRDRRPGAPKWARMPRRPPEAPKDGASGRGGPPSAP